MSVRRVIRRRQDGSLREFLLVDVKLQRASGEVVRVRKVAPIQTVRAARAYERELREQLLAGDEGDAIVPVGGRSEAPQSPDAGTARAVAECPTLAAFVPEFMRFQASPSASRRGANKPGELREKQRLLDNHLLPAFGALPLDQISARLIDRYVAAKSSPAPAPAPAPSRSPAISTTPADASSATPRAGVPTSALPPADAASATRRARVPARALAPATIANHLILLRRILSVAHRWELIPRVPAIQCPAVDNHRLDFLTFDEADRLIAAAQLRWRLLLLLAIRSGLRLGELRALRWSDLHLDEGYLRVEQNRTRAGLGSPKSGRPRTVDLAHDVLRALREHAPPPAWRRHPEALVFANPDASPLSAGQIYRAVQAAARAGGLGRRVHPHMLRHTFASHCVMRGIPLAVVKEWLGHADQRMTERYAQLAPEVRSSFADRLASGSTSSSLGAAPAVSGPGTKSLRPSGSSLGAPARPLGAVDGA